MKSKQFGFTILILVATITLLAIGLSNYFYSIPKTTGIVDTISIHHSDTGSSTGKNPEKIINNPVVKNISNKVNSNTNILNISITNKEIVFGLSPTIHFTPNINSDFRGTNKIVLQIIGPNGSIVESYDTVWPFSTSGCTGDCPAPEALDPNKENSTIPPLLTTGNLMSGKYILIGVSEGNKIKIPDFEFKLNTSVADALIPTRSLGQYTLSSFLYSFPPSKNYIDYMLSYSKESNRNEPSKVDIYIENPPSNNEAKKLSDEIIANRKSVGKSEFENVDIGTYSIKHVIDNTGGPYKTDELLWVSDKKFIQIYFEPSLFNDAKSITEKYLIKYPATN